MAGAIELGLFVVRLSKNVHKTNLRQSIKNLSGDIVKLDFDFLQIVT